MASGGEIMYEPDFDSASDDDDTVSERPLTNGTLGENKQTKDNKNNTSGNKINKQKPKLKKKLSQKRKEENVTGARKSSEKNKSPTSKSGVRNPSLSEKEEIEAHAPSPSSSRASSPKVSRKHTASQKEALKPKKKTKKTEGKMKNEHNVSQPKKDDLNEEERLKTKKSIEEDTEKYIGRLDRQGDQGWEVKGMS